MISVDAARQLVAENVIPLSEVELSLAGASGKVLAQDVFAETDVPAFAQSAMDGYAFYFDDWKVNSALKIAGEIPAGTSTDRSLNKDEAIRIFTGAPVPQGANTVVMQERTRITDQGLFISDDRLMVGGHVRPAGSEIKKGALAIQKNTLLTPAAIGFLAALGVGRVKVYPDPVISIIVTGDELQEPGEILNYGQVYESNSYTLSAALQQVGLTASRIFKAKDNSAELSAIMEQALKLSDLVILTGGVSVGDYDFVLKAAENCGVYTVFHNIKQRPGKPLFFGKREEKAVFGLPGNPSSVLTCFYMYVLPALKLLTKRPLQLQQLKVPLKNSYTKQHQLTHFLKGWYDGVQVVILEAQESYRLSSFAHANCLVELGVDARLYPDAEPVNIHLL